MRPLAVTVIAYLVGSIPFGYLIVKATRDADIRQTGSGGTGATNVSRRAGKAAGVLTLLLDALKGAAAVMIASWIVGVPLWVDDPGSTHRVFSTMEAITHAYWTVAAASVAVIVGHIFPVWLGFRGGKGVATGAGVFLMLMPWALPVAAVIFVLIVWRTRYVSLGSIIAAAAIPMFIWLQDALIRPVGHRIPTMTAAAAGAILIIFAHRANVRRLVDGTENKFG